jgi:hypothetical protein
MICEYAEQRREAEIENMRCHFCPSFKGILKRVIFNAAETIWVKRLSCSCIPSAPPGPTPSSTRKIAGAFTTIRNTPRDPLENFGSIYRYRSQHLARFVTIQGGIK